MISEASKQLLELLRDKNEGNVSVAKDLCDILDMSSDSVYRRLRGEVDFTLTEVAKIATHYGISVDALVTGMSTSSSFSYNNMYDQRSVFATYLGTINEMLDKVRKDNGKVTYICNDLPVSQSFKNPVLRAFKIFYWQKVVLGRDEYKKVKFGGDFHLTDTVNHSIDTMLDHYRHVECEEIWNENSLDSTIRQIEYCHGLGLYESEEDFIRVKDSLMDTIDQLEAYLDELDKEDSLFHFYTCSIELGNNCVQMQRKDRYYTFLNFSIFNSVSTSSKGFGEEVAAWRRSLLKKSTQIAGESEVRRHQFFNQLREKIESLQ